MGPGEAIVALVVVGLPVILLMIIANRWVKLREKNRLVADPSNPRDQVQAGTTEAQGIELEWLGRVAPQLDEAEILRRLRTDDQTRAIGDALLDQRTIAGIGNLWKCEGCFAAGIEREALAAAMAVPHDECVSVALGPEVVRRRDTRREEHGGRERQQDAARRPRSPGGPPPRGASPRFSAGAVGVGRLRP